MTNWIRPQYSRNAVNRAGSQAANDDFVSDSDRDRAFAIIGNWRSAHAYPLQALKMTLLKRARRCDSAALIAQRLKRLSSIEAKLRRFERMKLSQMQDIGGCRAVVSDIAQLRSLVALYQSDISKRPLELPLRAPERSQACEVYPYVLHPKADGYRGVHFVYKYHTREDSELAVFAGLRIEIQLRSRVQHAWATALETVDTFTNQALKTGFGRAPWKRFFALMGSSLALREKTPLVPGTPQTKAALAEELRLSEKGLNAISVLESLGMAVQHLTTVVPKNVGAFLLELDVANRIIKVTPFASASLDLATESYLEVEKRRGNDPSIQSVLVSVESLTALRSAYPNYYLDTAQFVATVRQALPRARSRR